MAAVNYLNLGNTASSSFVPGNWMTTTTTGSTIIWPSTTNVVYSTVMLPTYQLAPLVEGPPEGWNPYLSASDLLAKFAKFAMEEAQLGRDDFLEMPIKYFIQWLIWEAKEHAKVDLPDEVGPLRLKRHRCRACGRFIPWRFRNAGIWFCGPEHLERMVTRRGLLPQAA